MQHQPRWLSKRFNEQAGWDVRDNYYRNDPAENHAKNPRKDHVWIAGNVQEIEVAIYQALRSNDPEAYPCQAEHNGVMHGDAESQRDHVKQDRHRGWYHPKLR